MEDLIENYFFDEVELHDLDILKEDTHQLETHAIASGVI